MDIKNNLGHIINTNVFREEALHFSKYGYYCADPEDSPSWEDYWLEQKRRCLYGYESAGVKITGDFYYYLNFFPIKKVDNSISRGNRSRKILDFPDFWDGDYNMFWIREIARNGILESIGYDKHQESIILEKPEEERNKILLDEYDRLQLYFKPYIEDLLGGKDLIIGKSRRKGMSYKSAAIACKNFFHIPKSYTMFIAYEKKYLFPGQKTVFGKVKDNISFINKHTAWIQPSDFINKQGHIKASYKEYKNGSEVEAGFLSEIEAVSMKDNPDSGRGADAYDIFGEEAGAWGTPGGLIDTLSAMRSSSEAGKYKVGMITLYGTSGDTLGSTVDFSNLFNRPLANNFMAFYDIWGDIPEKIEGLFIPKQLNMEGFYNDNGMSDINSAREAEKLTRKNLESKGATSTDLRKRMQEEPLNSAEAFSIISFNNLPIVELENRRNLVLSKQLYNNGTPVDMYYEKGILNIRPLLNAKPIISYRDVPQNIEGCPVIYKHPNPNYPKNSYAIGYDPYRQDKGTSLAGITVIDKITQRIAAIYIGRKSEPEDVDRIAEMFADYYSSKIMYENEVTSVKTYFKKIKRLNLLAFQPDYVISGNIKKSTVKRIYGCHMVDRLKDAGERYLKQWLLSVVDFDEDGNKIIVIDTIDDLRFLEECIAYFRKGNFDLVSASFMSLFDMEETILKGNDYENEDEEATGNVAQLLEQFKMMTND